MSTSLESIMPSAPMAVERPVARDLLSFLIVGGLAALSYVVLSTLMIGLDTGVADWVVSAISYAVHVIPVYLAHRRFSFRSRAPHAVVLPRYVAVQLSAVVLAAIFSYVCYRVIGLRPLFAAALVTILTAGVNFFVLRLWAFAHRK